MMLAGTRGVVGWKILTDWRSEPPITVCAWDVRVGDGRVHWRKALEGASWVDVPAVEAATEAFLDECERRASLKK